MDKYLLAILKLVNTIIIPDLGALTITNQETGEILFMPYLKHDDGKLSSHIAEKEGMEEIEAKNLIAKYVREIKIELDKGESYDMYQFGSFLKVDGEIVFRNWNQLNQESQETVTKPVAIEEISDEVSAEKTQDEELVQLEDVIKNSINDVEEITEEIEVTIESIKEEKDSQMEENPPRKKMTILEKEEFNANVNKMNELKEAQENAKQKSKKSVGFWMLIALLGIVVVGSIYGALNFDEIKQHVPFLADEEVVSEESVNHLEEMKQIVGESENIEKTENENSELAEGNEDEIEDTPEISEDDSNEIDNEPTLNEIAPVSSNEKNYHAIAGAFTSKNNADRLVQTLIDKGLPASSFELNGKHMVSAQGFNTMQEANSAIGNIRENVPGAWIYKAN